MADVNDVLAANRAAVLDLVTAAERSAATWTTPRAPGKWSPSQVVEHFEQMFGVKLEPVDDADEEEPMRFSITKR